MSRGGYQRTPPMSAAVAPIGSLGLRTEKRLRDPQRIASARKPTNCRFSPLSPGRLMPPRLEACLPRQARPARASPISMATNPVCRRALQVGQMRPMRWLGDPKATGSLGKPASIALAAANDAALIPLRQASPLRRTTWMLCFGRRRRSERTADSEALAPASLTTAPRRLSRQFGGGF